MPKKAAWPSDGMPRKLVGEAADDGPALPERGGEQHKADDAHRIATRFERITKRERHRGDRGDQNE